MAVHSERRGAVTLITIDRPTVRNAVDRPTAAALSAAFRAFDADDDARVAILTGAGGFFCAGADLTAFADGRGNRIAPDGDGPMGPTRMVLSKPVIAAIAGPAVAGGLELALWCDLRVAEESATLGVLCRRWGVPLIDGGTVRLPRLIGLSHALDLILTGRSVTAREALAMGLVNRVVLDGEAVKSAFLLADGIAGSPPNALRSDRLSTLAQAGLPVEAALAQEFQLGLATLESGDALAGANRFSAGAGRHGADD